MIDAIIVLLGIFYLVYKSFREKNRQPVYCAVILLMVHLSQWPFYLPITIAFGSLGLFAGGLVFYEYYVKRKDKLAITFCILFIAFGIIFFFQAIPLNHPIVYKVISKVREIANK